RLSVQRLAFSLCNRPAGSDSIESLGSGTLRRHGEDDPKAPGKEVVMKKTTVAVLALAIALVAAAPTTEAQIKVNIGGGKRKDEAKTKNIHGVVQDLRGKPIAGARILIRNVKDNTTRTVTTDEKGSYSVLGL